MGIGTKADARRKVQKMFSEIEGIVKEDTAKSMNELGKEILILAIKRAPYRTGYLVNSAFLETPREWRGNKLLLRLGFRASYAKVVEETHPNQRHYLQSSVDTVWHARMNSGQPLKLNKSRARRQNIKRIVINV